MKPLSRRRFELTRVAVVLYFFAWVAGLVAALRAVDGVLADIAVGIGFGLLAFPLSLTELTQSYEDYAATHRSEHE